MPNSYGNKKKKKKITFYVDIIGKMCYTKLDLNEKR